jgi:hypothetical protein
MQQKNALTRCLLLARNRRAGRDQICPLLKAYRPSRRAADDFPVRPKRRQTAAARTLTAAGSDAPDDIAGCDSRSPALPLDTCVSSRHHIPRTFAGPAAIQFRRRIAHGWLHARSPALHQTRRADACCGSGIRDLRWTARYRRHAPPTPLHRSLRAHARTRDRTRDHRRRADTRTNAFTASLHGSLWTDARTHDRSQYQRRRACQRRTNAFLARLRRPWRTRAYARDRTRDHRRGAAHGSFRQRDARVVVCRIGVAIAGCRGRSDCRAIRDGRVRCCAPGKSSDRDRADNSGPGWTAADIGACQCTASRHRRRA